MEFWKLKKKNEKKKEGWRIGGLFSSQTHLLMSLLWMLVTLVNPLMLLLVFFPL
jgi:hypothetical protein